MTITREDRTLEFLRTTVNRIFDSLKQTERQLVELYPQFNTVLPDEITFVHSEELQERYPTLSPLDRERAVTKEHGAVFLVGVGHPLPGTGVPHDERAADYDDWHTENSSGFRGLNGDILVWDEATNDRVELSSMGIRVDATALQRQSEIQGVWEATKDQEYHQRVQREELVFSIGGGIGLDRISFFFLRKQHIGEVQVGVWPEEQMKQFPLLA
jgi:aspartate--ammonia ligase